MKRAPLHLIALALLYGAFAAAAPPIEVSIEAQRPGPTINRNIFGQFAEHLGTGVYGGIWVGKNSPIPNVRGIRSDVVAALRNLHVPNVRWPGGCFADEYHWRDGIGPAEQRRTTVNSNWGGALDPNSFGTDEFMDFINQIGSEAYVTLNVGSGSPREAADWLAYMTAPAATSAGKERAANGHPAPYRVRFLGLGNESWGCGGAMSPDYYVSQMKLYSRFAHNFNTQQAGGEAMRRIAVGADGAATDYLEAVMRAWHEKVWSWNIEAVSLHSYTSVTWPPSLPSEHFGKDDYARTVKDTLKMDALIDRDAAIMDKYDAQKVVALAVDEWGVWLAPLPGSNPAFLIQQNSLRDAIVAALNLDIFARHADRVRMGNIAQMANVLQAMIMTDDARMVLTPTYHVFRLYVPFQDAMLLPVRFDAGEYSYDGLKLPRLDVIAARDDQGSVWLAAINIDPEGSVRITAKLEGKRIHAMRGEVLTAPRVDSMNTFDAPDAVMPRPISGTIRNAEATIVLPPKSVTVVRIT